MLSAMTPFLEFLFSVVFLFLCCLILMLYMHKLLAIVVQFFLRYFVLPSSTRVTLGGILFSPLNVRVFIQNFTYRDENMSMHIVDGYVSFMFWDAWLKNSKWLFVRDFMITDSLKGMRCRVQVKFRWVRGVIVDVLREEKKLRVRIESNAAMDDDEAVNEFGTPLDLAEDMGPSDVHLASGDVNLNTSEMCSVNITDTLRLGRTVAQPTDEFYQIYSPLECGNRSDDYDAVMTSMNMQNNSGREEQGGAAAAAETESIKLFDASVVQIRQNRGRVLVHLNGMGLCLYNATGNYKNISEGQQQAENTNVPDQRISVHRWAVRNIVNRIFPEDEVAAADEIEMHSQNDDLTNTLRREALETQQRLKKTRNLMQRFFNFIGAVEVELFTSYIDIGGARANHPYFLHIGFKRGEAHSYLTQDGVSSVDLFRFVTELTLEKVNARWSVMQKEEETLTVQRKQKNTWYKSFMLMFNGTQSDNPNEAEPTSTFQSSELIHDYGIIIGENGKENASLHLVFYRDAANIYAGEDVSDRTQLPRMGFEIFVDASTLGYGPWSHYSFMQVKDFFYPQTYRPLEPLKFEVGKTRPIASFEVFVEFLRDTNLCISFKRKAPAPSPPFGISDSGRKGVMILTLGKGSQYIQKPSFLLNGEEKQEFESLLVGKNVWIATNGIRETSTILAKMETMELFIDRLDSKNYFGRKLWNILPKLHSSEMWWYMDYNLFFMDLLTDWQFVPEMYHGVPLTTETYNTYSKFVNEFFPVVRRFEVFLDGSTILHINANTENIIFTDDANDVSGNAFLTVSTNSSGYFFMTLPGDSYFLSASTEVNRPFKLVTRSINVRMSLPRTHPLFELVDSEVSFAEIDEFVIDGSMTVNVPNQTVPQDKTPMESMSGVAILSNYLSLNMRLDGVGGFLTAVHIRTFIDVYENMFGYSQCVIGPEELFWPLSKTLTQTGVPMNIRQRFNEFLQKDQPHANNLEIDITLIVDNIDVTLQAAPKRIPALNLRCGQFSFAFMRQNAVNDLSLTLSPFAARFYDDAGDKLVPKSNICCGGATVSMIRHFSPLPLRTLFHGTTDIIINKISFDVTVEQLTMLAQLSELFMGQFTMRDLGLLSEVDNARMAASYSAEYIRSSGDGLTNAPKNVPSAKTANERFSRMQGTNTAMPQRATSKVVPEAYKCTSAADMHEAVNRCLARGNSQMIKVSLYDIVPEAVTVSFQNFLDEAERSADMSKDYAVMTMLVSVEGVNGCARVGENGYFALQIPSGIQIASSTLNDFNSTSRMSASLRSVALRGFYCQNDDKPFVPSGSEFLEVFHVETGICVRQYAAYPFDKELGVHMLKQAKFVEENRVENLFACKFPVPLQQQPSTPITTTCSLREPNTTPRPVGLPTGSSENIVLPQVLISTLRPQLFNEQVEEKSALQQDEQQSQLNPEEEKEKEEEEEEVVVQEPSLAPQLPTFQQLEISANQPITDAPGASTILMDNLEQVDAIHEIRPSMKTPAASLSSAGFHTLATDDNATSNVFHTCRSTSETFFSPVEDEADDDDDDVVVVNDEETEQEMDSYESEFADSALSVDNFQPRALPTGLKDDMHAFSGNNPLADGIHQEPFERFLRPYFLNHTMPADMTLLDYDPRSRFGRRGCYRNRTNIYAPIPSVHFFASMDSNQAPQFLIGKQMFRTDAPMPDDDAWARRAADNKRRVREGATSRQIHIETISPLAVLVTQQFVQSLYFEAESRIHVTQKLLKAAVFTPSVSLDAYRWLSTEERLPVGPPKNIREILKQRRRIHNKEHSRNRIQQKRWLSEVKTISVVLPCVEAKVLTNLPVPIGNLPSGFETVEGVYTTTIGMRSFQFVLQQAFPPLHVAMRSESKTHSASVTFSSIAVITQVEFEPLPRKGNLSIKIPGILYEEEKDTIGVAYVSSVCCRGRLKMTPGAENGACRLTMNTVALHLTRDFFDYLQSIKSMLLRLRSARLLSSEETPAEEFPAPHHMTQPTMDSFTEIAESNDNESSTHDQSQLHSVAINGTRIIQGVGSIAVIRVELIDVTREGQYLCVHTERTNVLETLKPSVQFIAKIPTRRRVPNQISSPLLTLQPLRPRPPLPQPQPPEARQERHGSVQFIGEVTSLNVRCFPSLLNVIGAAKGKDNIYGKQEATRASVPHLLRDLLAPPGKLNDQLAVLYAYKGGLTLRKLDLSMMHSTHNYLQVHAENLTGFGEARTDPVSSRECVQASVSDGAISERVRRKLRSWANSARVRAPKSQFATPPSVTPQLKLKRTASFFAQTLLMQYVVEAMTPLPGALNQQATVLSARATYAALGMHEADQHKPDEENLTPTREKTAAPTGEQVNLQLEIVGVHVEFPYHPHASDTVYPQLHQWMRGWIEARQPFRTMRRDPFSKNGSLISGFQIPTRALQAYCCAMQVREINFDVGLRKSIHLILNVPLCSAFLTASSEKRLAIKAHLHPFTLTSFGQTNIQQTVKLPSAYFIYAEDEVRRNGTCILETVEITVSPSIIGHVILTCDKILTLREALLHPIPTNLDDDMLVSQNVLTSGVFDYSNLASPVALAYPANNQEQRQLLGGESAPVNAEESLTAPPNVHNTRLLFLLEGLRVSYLTSMTSLRFSVKKLNALTTVSPQEEGRKTKVVLNVTNAQVALVDRDGHDRKQAALQSLRMARSEVSAPSTNPAGGDVRLASVSVESDYSTGALRPLGGFVWGLIETSFTLSSERKDDHSELRTAMGSLSARSGGGPVEERDLPEMESIGNSTTYWNLAIVSPIVIMRVGLIPLLQRCIDETKGLTKRRKFVSERENLTLRRKLLKSQVYRRLAHERRVMDLEAERSQQSLQERLPDFTSHDPSRNNALYGRRASFSRAPTLNSMGKNNNNNNQDNDLGVETNGKADPFTATSDNKFLIKVTNFLVVVPFGDAAYRNILEERPDVFSNHGGRSDRRRGGSHLDRMRFIPTMALKTKVVFATVTCGVQHSQSYVPVIQPPELSSVGADALPGHTGPTVQATTTKLKFTARLALENVRVYCSDGSPLPADAKAADFVNRTQIFGGLGILTAFNSTEYDKSSSKVSYKSIDIPLNITKRAAEVRVGAIIDASAPVVIISTRFVSILSQFTQEMPTMDLPPFSPLPRNGPLTNSVDHSFHGVRQSQTPERHVDPMKSNLSFPVPLPQDQQHSNSQPHSPRQEPIRYYFDLTMRLDRGEMQIFSIKKESPSVPQTSMEGARSKLTRSQWRRVRFSTEDGGGNGERTVGRNGGRMTVLLRVPIPDVSLGATGVLCGNENDDEEIVINVEVRASTIEIGPSITLLAREIEEWSRVHDRDSSERVTKIMNLVQEWENEVSVDNLIIPKLTFADIALPLPRSFAETLRFLRKSSAGAHIGTPDSNSFSSSGARKRNAQRDGSNATADNTPDIPIFRQATTPRKGVKKRTKSSPGSPLIMTRVNPLAESHSASALVDVQRKKKSKNVFNSLHLCITGFRLVLSTDPEATVNLSFFFDERLGRADVFINKVRKSSALHSHRHCAIKEPLVSFIVSLHGVRVECQAKLEVKSLEMHIPAVVINAALRREKSGSLVSVCGHLPYDVPGGAELELTVRAQHASQLYIVQELWHKTLLELLSSIRHMFARGAPAQIISENVRQNVIAQRRSALTKSPYIELERSHTSKKHAVNSLIVALSVVRGKVRFDMGSGNAQQASLACANLALEIISPETDAARKVRFDTAVRSLALRSEGVLSGVATLESVFLKAFFIENNEGMLHFERSPGQRTFRGVLYAQKLNVTFKKHQLNDVFECTVAEFRVCVMDGIGEEDYTTLQVDVFLNKGNVVVTPNTFSAFDNTISGFRKIAASQRAVAEAKLGCGTTSKGDGSRVRRTREKRRDVGRVLDMQSPSIAKEYSFGSIGQECSTPIQSPFLPSSANKEAVFAFMGTPLSRIPCGEIQVKLEQTTLLLRSASGSGGGSSTGCLIASFPKATFSFAECPSERFTTVKKILVFDAYNMELYRPGALKSLIIGFRGANKFEFYTRQKLNDKEVGFVLTLHQVNPWTGNPCLMDFQEIIQLARSFTAKGNAEVSYRFGKPVGPHEQVWGESSQSPSRSSPTNVVETGSSPNKVQPVEPIPMVIPQLSSEVSRTRESSAENPVVDDTRYLKALRNVKFSPQLRFGGDVSVNIDVILNWFGVTEKMLPNILHAKVCDRMERALSCLSKKTSERVRPPKGS